MTTMIDNIEITPPTEIDLLLKVACHAEAVAERDIRLAKQQLTRYAAKLIDYIRPETVKLTWDEVTDLLPNVPGYDSGGVTRRLADLVGAQIRYESEGVIIRAIGVEFRRRGGWTRAYLCTSVNGHVHREMSCHTLYPTSGLDLRAEFSGFPEVEIVDAAGERACTVCYPSAPVEVLARPTRIFTDDEVKRAARREELAAKRAEAARKRVELVVWESWRTGVWRQRDREWKTERAVMMWITDEVESLAIAIKNRHPEDAEKYRENIRAVAAVIALRTGGEVDAVIAEILAKGRKKLQRWGSIANVNITV